jgi:bifunctional non-homologous end joining protein LigD
VSGPREPMPSALRPMKARLGTLPADEAGYGFEIKWDGVRFLAYVARGRVRLQSRTGREMTERFPEADALLESLGRRQAVIDGELVALDDEGRPSFQMLQGRMHLASELLVRERMSSIPVTLIAFDLLHLSGRSIREQAYERRRELLEGLGLDGPRLQTPRWHRGEGAALLAASRERGLEGVVAKRLGSRYLPGKRSEAWLKVKNHRSQEVVIGGWLPGKGRRSNTLGALLAGYYEDGELRYAGKVGTGFKEADLRLLIEKLAPLRLEASPFSGRQPQRGSIFVEPELVAEVEFGEWTNAGTMRHPSFKGLRDDKPAREVVREEPG